MHRRGDRFANRTDRSRSSRALVLGAVVAVLLGVLGSICAAPVSAGGIPLIPSDPPESTTTSTTEAPPATPSNPEESSGLSVSPAIVDNAVNPGATFVTRILLTNITPRAVPIEVGKSKLETDQIKTGTFDSRYDISSWLSLDTDMFILPSQEQRVIDVTVKVPLDAEPGGHYSTIYFAALPSAPTPEGGGQALLNARVGVVFLLNVSGEIRAGAELAGPITTPSPQYEAGASVFRFGIRNTGNVHFEPHGELVVKDLFGRQVKSLPLKPGYVLPGGQLDYDVTWERGLRPGFYTASVKVDAGLELRGESKRFLVLPVILLVPLGILLLVVAIVIWKRLARRRRRRSRQRAIDVITATEPAPEDVDPPVTK